MRKGYQTERQFITGLFVHEDRLNIHFLLDKCAKHFGSFQQAMYIVADAITSELLTEMLLGDVKINRI